MGFFTRAAMDALMKTTHPEINRRQCWNLHPHRKSCTACKDICPYGDQIFTRQGLGPLHRLRSVRLRMPQPLHLPLAGAGGARHLCRRHRQRYHLDRL